MLKTAHPLDLLLVVLAAATPGGALLYWLAGSGRMQIDFALAIAFLAGSALGMLLVIGGLVWFAMYFFGPHRKG
jgi:hypothetical protein